jgi:hypothetical protein
VLARDAGMANVLAGVNTGREPGYCRPDDFVLDDWR